MLPTIDLLQVRPHHGDQKAGFEELTRRLVLAEELPDVLEIENRGPGADGGVEVLVRFKDGSSWGWQSKFFSSFGVSQVNQLKESFRSAIKHFGADEKGRLTKYVVALPINLSGSGTSKNSDARKRWTKFIVWAKEEAKKAISRVIKIELWDETAFMSRLQRSDGLYPGILAYWFDHTVFNTEWFQKQLSSAIAALDDRYHPEDHVDVHALRAFDVVFHRGPVRGDLRRDFGEARSIYPVAADVAGAGISPLDPAVLSRINQSLEQFVALEAGVDRPVNEPWPVHRWNSAWSELVFERLQPTYHSLSRALEEAGHEWRSERQEQLRRRLQLRSQQREAFGSPWQRYFGVEETRAVLFVGEAGTGKSHLLAKAAQDASAGDSPVLLFLGQDFVHGDYRSIILHRIDLVGLSFETLLGALDAAAIAADSRALILIDALNEGDGLNIWPKELARLLEEVRRFQRIVLGVSCRAEYLDATIPKSVRQKFIRIDVRGFESFEEQEKAAQVYLDRRGIVRPASPSLDPEFTNPLFLRIAAESLVRSGQSAFPRGLRGAQRVFGFVLEVRGRFLGAGRDGTDDLIIPLRRSLLSLAKAMADACLDYISLQDAASIINGEFASYPSPLGKAWLDVLRGNGFLRKDLLATAAVDDFASTAQEVIRFTFQRLADHLMAEALLENVKNTEGLFIEGGPLTFVVKSERRQLTNRSGRKRRARSRDERDVSIRRKWTGLCATLWIAIAEKFGRELIDLPGIKQNRPSEVVRWTGFQEPFMESLRWRDSKAFTNRTREIALWFFDDFARERLPLYLEMALVAQHPWNIEYIDSAIVKASMPERDAHWSMAFADMHGRAYRNALRIVDWCQNADLSRAEDDTIELAAITLGWFLTVTNRTLRDRATKALAATFYCHPAFIEKTLRRFGDLNDEYLRERVFAAAYGAILHLRSEPEIVSSCAKAAFEIIFQHDPTCKHMTLRDYARGLVEVARARNVLPKDVKLALCRPPYCSVPITKWPSLARVRRLTKEREADEIFSSAVGWVNKDGRQGLAGDFGRYTMAHIEHAFSDQPRKGGVPDSPSIRKAKFWQQASAISPKIAALADQLLRANTRVIRQKASRAPRIEIEKEDGLKITVKPWYENDPGVAQAIRDLNDIEARFKAALPESFRRRYKARELLPESGDEKPFRFELSRGQCWVAWRALDLGWNKRLHGEAEHLFVRGISRTEHNVERIGKKYQWIAYNELCGHLIDHHWYFSGWGDRAVPFDRVDDFDSRDIDPTIWLNGEDESRRRVGGVGLPVVRTLKTDFKAKSVDESIAWTKTLRDLLNPAELIEAIDAQGKMWWTTHLWYQDTGYLAKLGGDNAFRTAQGAVNMLILRRDDLSKFNEAARGRNFGNDHMLGGGETRAIFVGEHSWDSGVFLSNRDGKIELTEEYFGVRYCLPTVRLTIKRGEYDLSTTADRSVTAPNSDLVVSLAMHVEGPRAVRFVTTEQETVFIDIDAAGSDDNRTLVRADQLERALAPQGLCPLWVFWSEKDGGLGHGPNYASRHDQVSRTVFGGCFWRSDDTWKTSGVWLVDRNRND